MLSRLGLALQSENGEKCGGDVEVDETFIVGRASTMHRCKIMGVLEPIPSNRRRHARPVIDAHVSVQPFHLFRYLDETGDPLQHHKGSYAVGFALKRILNKRLTYTALTGWELPQTC